MTTDKKPPKQFYASIFNWETEEYPMEGMGYTVLKVAGNLIGGIMPIPPDCQGMAPSWYAYVTVDDVDVIVEKVPTFGGKFFRPPMDIPEIGRFCVLRDPQGGVICAITYLQK